MYWTLVVGRAVADPERFRQLLGRMRPGGMEAEFTEQGAPGWKKAAGLRPDLILLALEGSEEEAEEAVREWKTRQPQAKLAAVKLGGGADPAAGSAGESEALPGPLEAGAAAGLIGELAARLHAERREREAELRLAERTMELMPLTEQELVLSLMLEDEPEEVLGPLFAGLGLSEVYGRAAVIALPEADGALQLPAGMGAVQLYEAVRSKAKADGEFAVVGPAVGRWLAVLRLGTRPQAEAPGFEGSCRAWAESLAGFLTMQLGLRCLIGLGCLGQGAEGLRQSLRKAAEAMEPAGGEGAAEAAQVPWAAGRDAIRQELQLLREERERRLRPAVQPEPAAGGLAESAGGAEPVPSGPLDAPFAPTGR
ncbi:hypothetical protein ACVNS2_36505 [Paenibacillus caseinilyticus]|uniref:CdaR GGDEF-like domain-containing protein n=1 Tax=Paenibacillus mucilaginosus K02 TaxID=997761 RepID=I0BUZ2_9BACL|nr:hypothetical protein [Paenibacillus mucilaginosus]AFH66189.2 hypothetical protein B2K_36770 [Paenibacillus mucilaginosus K02]